MRTYNSTKQYTIEGFETPFENRLLETNRWIKLANSIPWDACAGIYLEKLSPTMGRPSIDARLAIGALLIKHLKGISDREVVSVIQENLYLQYFVGFSSFQPHPSFDPSLMVTLRKRMGEVEFDEMNDLIIRKALNLPEPEEEEISDEDPNSGLSQPASASSSPEQSASQASEEQTSNHPGNKGKLKLDATVVDQMIVYPTDLNLLNTAREETERLIDQLFKQTNRIIKPRTYRRKARRAYLNISKKKRKTRKEIRKGIGQQLRFLRRNLLTINKLWDEIDSPIAPFESFRDLRIFWVINLLYDQQKKMYDERINRHDDRIVNIYQPYVRPILRGKDKHKVEFGAKIGASEFDGFTRLDHLSWDAYNESGDLENQVQRYRRLTGYYPELILVDQIYMTRKNRKYLKEKGIRHVGKTIGKPKELTVYQKRKQKKERNMRNHIEGKFGQGKNAYQLKGVRTRRADTSASWIACVILVMNLVRWEKIMPMIWMLIHLAALFLPFLLNRSYSSRFQHLKYSSFEK